jgi:hypothetical protein
MRLLAGENLEGKGRRCRDDHYSQPVWARCVEWGRLTWPPRLPHHQSLPLPFLSSSSSNTSPIPTTAPTEAPQQSNGSVNLGVGIGVPVGTAALAAVGFFLWRRRRHYHRDLDDRYPLSEMPHDERKVHEVGNAQGYESLHELPNDNRKINEFRVLEVAKAYMSCRWTVISTVVPSSRAADSGVLILAVTGYL